MATFIERATKWLNTKAGQLEKRAERKAFFRELNQWRKKNSPRSERTSLPGDM